MDINLLTHVTILIFAFFVVFCSFAFLVIDMFSRVDYLKDKAPWLQRIAERRSAIGVLLLVAIFLLVGDGYELIAKELPEAGALRVMFSLPAPGIVIQKHIIKTTGSGRLDRDMNDQQSSHLYEQLKKIAETANAPSELTAITIVHPYPQDRESQHLFMRLNKVFNDAHWKATPSQGWPVPGLEAAGQHEMPIGIWIITSSQYLRYELWSDLQQAGLDSRERPEYLPTNLKGTILVIGYKDAPF